MGAMHRENRPTDRRDLRVLGVAAGALTLGAAAAVSTSPVGEIGAFGGALMAAADYVSDAIALGLQTAPALTLPILMALAFPLVALISRFADRSRRVRNATRRYRAAGNSAANRDIPAQAGRDLHGPPFLEVAGVAGGGARYEILRDMTRIGREDDNDVRIENAAVHRYHAAISREDADDWRITDLSGLDGKGLAVNGRRCADAILHDGDVIQLGPGRLRFHAGAV